MKEHGPKSTKELEHSNIERQGFDTKNDVNKLTETESSSRELAKELLKAGYGTLEFSRRNNNINSVTIKNSAGEIIYFSEDPSDIEQFMEIEMPE